MLLLPPAKLHELWEITLLSTMEITAAQANPNTYQQQAAALSVEHGHKLLGLVISEVDQVLVVRQRGAMRSLGSTDLNQRPSLPAEVVALLS